MGTHDVMSLVISGIVYASGMMNSYATVNIEITDTALINQFEQGQMNYFSIEEGGKIVKQSEDEV